MGEGTKGYGETGMKQPVSIMTRCKNCGSLIAFICLNWEMGKRFEVPCIVCGEGYYVAFAIKGVNEATETPIASAFLRWDNENIDQNSPRV